MRDWELLLTTQGRGNQGLLPLSDRGMDTHLAHTTGHLQPLLGDWAESRYELRNADRIQRGVFGISLSFLAMLLETMRDRGPPLTQTG